jgi:hypothetical protein
LRWVLQADCAPILGYCQAEHWSIDCPLYLRDLFQCVYGRSTDGEALVDLDSFHLSFFPDDPTRILGRYCNAWWSFPSNCVYGSQTNWRGALTLYRRQIDIVPVQEESEFFMLMDEILWDMIKVRRGQRRTWEGVSGISDRVEELEVFIDISDTRFVPEIREDGAGWLHSWVRCVNSRGDAQLVAYMLASRARAAAYANKGSGSQLGVEAVSGRLVDCA